MMATSEYNVLPVLHPYDELDISSRTRAGIGILGRRPASMIDVIRRARRLLLEQGPFLAAFDAGMCDVVDLAAESQDITVLAICHGDK